MDDNNTSDRLGKFTSRHAPSHSNKVGKDLFRCPHRLTTAPLPGNCRWHNQKHLLSNYNASDHLGKFTSQHWPSHSNKVGKDLFGCPHRPFPGRACQDMDDNNTSDRLGKFTSRHAPSHSNKVGKDLLRCPHRLTTAPLAGNCQLHNQKHLLSNYNASDHLGKFTSRHWPSHSNKVGKDLFGCPHRPFPGRACQDMDDNNTSDRLGKFTSRHAPSHSNKVGKDLFRCPHRLTTAPLPGNCQLHNQKHLLSNYNASDHLGKFTSRHWPSHSNKVGKDLFGCPHRPFPGRACQDMDDNNTSDRLGKFTSRHAPSHSNKVGKDLFRCPHRLTTAPLPGNCRLHNQKHLLSNYNASDHLGKFTSQHWPSHSNKVGKDLFGCPHRPFPGRATQDMDDNNTSDRLGKFTSRHAPSHSNKVGKDLFRCPHRLTTAPLPGNCQLHRQKRLLSNNNASDHLGKFTSRHWPSHSNKVGKDLFGCPHRPFPGRATQDMDDNNTSDRLGKFTSRHSPSHSNKVGKDLFRCPHRLTTAPLPGNCQLHRQKHLLSNYNASDHLGKFTSQHWPSHSNKVGKDLFGCPHRPFPGWHVTV